MAEQGEYRQLNYRPHGSGREASSRRKQAAEAERFGRSIEPTVESYIGALQERGPRGVANALISRANVRWQNVRSNVPFVGAFTLPRLWRIPPIDAALTQAGAHMKADGTIGSSPAVPGDGWLGQLRWGVDSTALSAKYVLLAQPIGAAAVIRQQVERWTENRGGAIGIRREGMSRSEHISQVWRDYPRSISLSRIYDDMSELLHGRGRWLPVLRWEVADLCRWPPPGESMALGVMAELSILVQLVVGDTIPVTVPGLTPGNVDRLRSWRLVGDPPRPALYEVLHPALLPLSPTALASEAVDELAAAASAYEDGLRHLQTDGDTDEDLLVTLGFLHRRHRATQVAIGALEAEQERLGDEFDLSRITSRETHYTLIAEAAGLAGTWLDGERGNALIAGAQALRSAFHLWLEDDNRAMIAVRTIYESAARSRAWRTKPGRAAQAEARAPRTTLRDWAALAGWNRLAMLSRALGELSHFSYEAKWGGALEALSALQEDHETDEFAIHTARGAALDQTSRLLAIEAASGIAELSPELGQGVMELLGLDKSHGSDIEDWLQRAHDQRDFDFGESDFIRPDPDN